MSNRCCQTVWAALLVNAHWTPNKGGRTWTNCKKQRIQLQILLRSVIFWRKMYKCDCFVNYSFKGAFICHNYLKTFPFGLEVPHSVPAPTSGAVAMFYDKLLHQWRMCGPPAWWCCHYRVTQWTLESASKWQRNERNEEMPNKWKPRTTVTAII